MMRVPQHAQRRGPRYEQQGDPGRTRACNLQSGLTGPEGRDRRLMPCPLSRKVSYSNPLSRAPPLAIGMRIVSEDLVEVSLPEWLRGWT